MATMADPGSMSAAGWQVRVELAAVLRIAVRLDMHEGVDNHCSLLVPERTDRFLINPHRRHWSNIRARDIVEVDLEGMPVDGKEPPEATAFHIHSSLHRLCPSATCVLHTHMPYATALSMLEGGRVEPVVQGALKFFGQIAYGDGFSGLALNSDEGERLAAAQAGHRILFLANHGVIVVGASVACRR